MRKILLKEIEQSTVLAREIAEILADKYKKQEVEHEETSKMALGLVIQAIKQKLNWKEDDI